MIRKTNNFPTKKLISKEKAQSVNKLREVCLVPIENWSKNGMLLIGRRLFYEYHNNIFQLLENDHIKAITTLRKVRLFVCLFHRLTFFDTSKQLAASALD